MEKIKVGIIGSAGYTGGELIRILLNHPKVEISFAHSESNGNEPFYKVHKDLLGETEMKFSDEYHFDIDLIFLCVSAGNGKKFVENNYPHLKNIKVIDLSPDYRFSPKNRYGEMRFTYGLPEINRNEIIANPNFIANPGCFATGIELALIPLAFAGLLEDDLHINAVTGSTGAGQGLSPTVSFSWRNNNFSSYKVFEHQHLGEIAFIIKKLQAGYNKKINFIPNRGNFTRGIYSTVYTRCDLGLEKIENIYKYYYESHPFVHLSKEDLDLKSVINTNKCFINLRLNGDTLIITSVIDNLLKGASGQAVQNMNILYGWDENLGLKLKGVAF